MSTGMEVWTLDGVASGERGSDDSEQSRNQWMPAFLAGVLISPAGGGAPGVAKGGHCWRHEARESGADRFDSVWKPVVCSCGLRSEPRRHVQLGPLFNCFLTITVGANEQLRRKSSMASRMIWSVPRASFNTRHCPNNLCRQLKWDIVKDKDATIAWLDTWDTGDTGNLRPFKVGHFPGMNNVSTKCSLGRTLNAARAVFPNVRWTPANSVLWSSPRQYELYELPTVRHSR